MRLGDSFNLVTRSADAATGAVGGLDVQETSPWMGLRDAAGTQKQVRESLEN
jgi:hypothetical protein